MPMLCEGQTRSACGGAFLVVFAAHLHFYVSVWGWIFLLLETPLGFLYILCAVALLYWLGNSSICPFRQEVYLVMCFRCSPKKTLVPLPLSISVYLPTRQQGPVVGIKYLCQLVIPDHLNKLQNAPWHFYWRQLAADGTNVFLSEAIMTIKVSSGTWDQHLMTTLCPASATATSENSSFLRANCFIKMGNGSNRPQALMHHSRVKLLWSWVIGPNWPINEIRKQWPHPLLYIITKSLHLSGKFIILRVGAGGFLVLGVGVEPTEQNDFPWRPPFITPSA